MHSCSLHENAAATSASAGLGGGGSVMLRVLRQVLCNDAGECVESLLDVRIRVSGSLKEQHAQFLCQCLAIFSAHFL